MPILSECVMTESLKQYFMIGIGGMIGAIGRYSLSIVYENHSYGFPYSTLIVNLIGCFLLTFLLNQQKIKQILSPKLLMALSVGVIGSFTTFSTVTVEVINLWQNHL